MPILGLLKILELAFQEVCLQNIKEPGEVRDDLNTVGLRSLQSSTPLRSKNYDVLKKAATYIAVKRLMSAEWARTRGKEGALQVTGRVKLSMRKSEKGYY